MTKFNGVLRTVIIFILLIFLVGCTNTAEPNEPTVTPPSETPSGTEAFDYSEGFDENGLWKDIKALECVELSNYKGISIPKDVHNVSDDEIQLEIDSLLAEFTSRKEVKEGIIKDGDTVNIDYVGSVDGVEFENGSTEGLGTEVTIGKTSYIDDFIEQLIGHAPGESFDIEVTFPDEYDNNKELSGKDAVFAITINHIIEPIIPEFTDEFVTEKLAPYYGWSTVLDAKTYLHDGIQKMNIENYIHDYITKESVVNTLPDNLLRYQENILIQTFNGYAEYYNMEFNEFIGNIGISDIEALLERYIEENTENAKSYLVYQAVAEDVGITVQDSDVTEFFKTNMGSEDYSEAEERFGLPYIKSTVMTEKVMRYLYDNAVLE